MDDTLIDDREAEAMAILGCAISCQRAYACHGTRLCPHILEGVGMLHARFQSSIKACYRQGMEKMRIDILVAISISKEHHLKHRRHIII